MSTQRTREVYIRITDDQAGFVCTVKYGKFPAVVTEFALHPVPTLNALDEKALVLARKGSSRPAMREAQ